MLRNQRNRFKVIVFTTALFVFCMAGCTKANKDNMTGTAESVGQTEDVRNDNERRNSPLSETDYAIGKKPVGDTGNLYELCLVPEGGAVMMCYMGTYGGDLLVVYQLEDGRNYIVRINPLTMMEEAKSELPDGIYANNGVFVTTGGMVAVCNQMSGDIYLLNEDLSEYDRISFGQSDMLIKYVSQDLSRIIYEDYETGTVCSYDSATGEKVILYGDDKEEGVFYYVSGVYEADNCVLIGKSREGDAEPDCRLIRMDTGEVVQSYTTDLSKLEVAENFYIAYCGVGCLTEIVFGNVNSDTPEILAFADYEEYDYRYTDAENKVVISRKERIAGDEKQAVLSFYRLDLGLKQYELTVPHSDTEFVSDFMTYIENDELVIFEMIGASSGTVYVWDLLAENSACGDEKNYVCKWQGKNPADEDEMEELRGQAQEIGERHGVEIYIGDAVKECTTDTYEYVTTDNVVRIRQALSILDRALERYPDGMLAQLDDDFGGVLKIYLAGDILPADDMSIDTAVGVQNTLWEDTHLVLDINSVYDYESAIYHEIFHAIENHLNITDEGCIDDVMWDSYNPPDFVYDYDYIENQGSDDFTYVVGDTEEPVYFIDIYSKSFPLEDRARVMEYAMMEEKLQTGYFSGEHLRNKVKYLSNQIRAGFDTTGWPEVTDWEIWIR
ncbi:MAG: hypothetical protein K2G45_08965 [Lachnospiraceae bacterium]|nr:hypothetical protein [Lachnospiraceae bacterium]